MRPMSRALAATPLADLVNLKHVERPKDWDVPALAALFELLELTPGMAQLVAQGKDEPVRELQKAVDARVGRLVMARQALQAGFQFWGRNLLDDHAAGDLRRRLDAARAFLDPLQAFSSPGTLKNFPYSRQAVEAQRAGLDALGEVEALHALVGDFANAASYFPAAEAALPADHAWVERLLQVRDDLAARFLDPAQRSAAGFRRQAQNELGDLKRAYVDAYLALHMRARLGVDDERRKGRLLADKRLQKVRALAAIDLLPRRQLDDFQNRLAALESCFLLTAQELDAAAECPHCAFRPSAEPVGRRGRAPCCPAWTASWMRCWRRGRSILLTNLEDPTTREQLELLGPAQRDPVQAFIASRTLPDELQSRLRRRGRAGAVRSLEGGGHRRRTARRALSERLAGNAGRVEEALRRLRRRQGERAGRGEGTDRDRVAGGSSAGGGPASRRSRISRILRSPAAEMGFG